MRLLWPDAGWFGADQARDLTWGARIATGAEYPAVGPAMRNRIYLGPLYYYFWAVPFFFSGEPVAAYVFAGVLGVFATALTFEAGRRVGGAAVGLASALVFATMPLAVIDGRIAWAPAAIPVLCAAFLLAVVAVLHRPSLAAALGTSALAALMVQLHLAAAPIVVVAAVVIVSQAKRLGVRAVVSCALAGLVVLSPTLLAATVPTPGARDVASGPLDATAGRLMDILLVGSRAVSGLSPDPATWPGWIRIWLGAEAAWMVVVLVSALVLVLRLPILPRAAPVVAVLGTLATSLLAVLLLPWEAWHYYLDVALVPSAIVVGLVAVTVLGGPGWWLVVGMAIGRTALLLWWVHGAHTGGYVAANLDLLRLGGVPPGQATARARVPTVAARAEAAEALVGGLGIPPPGLWQRVHGPGFSDLDTDNGYFFERASSMHAPAAGEALVTYRGQVPASWRASLSAPIVAGPFEVLYYDPWLRRSSARLVGCGGGPPPGRPSASPLEYGAGELARSEWPCPDPEIEVSLEPPPQRGDATVVRVFARLDGPGRIVDLTVEPPGTARPIAESPPGLGRGIEVGADHARIRVRLALDGPASLDLFELRGH